MNSNLLKKAAIIMAVVLVIALIPAFARGHRNNWGNNYDGYSHNRNSSGYGHNGGSRGYGHNRSGYGCNSSGHGYGCNGYDCGYGYNRNSYGYGHNGYNSGYQLGGTIQSIDTNASTISVANADGTLAVVHINPNTNIINMTDFNSMDGYGRGDMNYYGDINTDGMTDAEIRLEIFNAREAAIEEWEEEIEDRTLDFDNLKTGDWVEVSILPTETSTREANAISVYR